MSTASGLLAREHVERRPPANVAVIGPLHAVTYPGGSQRFAYESGLTLHYEDAAAPGRLSRVGGNGPDVPIGYDGNGNLTTLPDVL